jgi:SAM-dependent methyltransferase
VNPDKIDIDDYSEKYLKERNKKLSFELILDHARRKQVLKSLNKYKHKHILEVGCGLKPLFQYCGKYESYIIVEPSNEFVQLAKRHAKGKSNITIIHGYMYEVYKKLLNLYPDFDFIILSSILHEVPHPEKLLQSIYQVCKKDTIVHINVPNVSSFHRLLAYEMGCIETIFEKSETEIKFQRHTRFDKQKLFKIVEKSGFQILSYGTYLIKPFSNEQMEKIINQNIVNKDIVKGLEKMAKYIPDLGCEMFVNVKIGA